MNRTLAQSLIHIIRQKRHVPALRERVRQAIHETVVRFKAEGRAA